ncbi:MAG: hypothetical protein JRM80_07395 [Nitrososphaerota archaeon]|nr:hypothetical protein [Nitrososphaerota archaeon]
MSLPPGASLNTLTAFLLEPATPATTSAAVGSFSTSVQDASSPAYSAGAAAKAYGLGTTPSVQVTFWSGDSCFGNTFVAGSAACNARAVLTTGDSLGFAGVPVAWSILSTYGAVSPSSSNTVANSTLNGVASATFTPTNVVLNSPSTLEATLGTSSIHWIQSVSTTAGTPNKVSITLPGNTTTTAPNHYERRAGFDSKHVAGAYVQGTGISVSLTDKFGNQINFATYHPTSLTISATSGGGRFSNATSTYVSVSCGTVVFPCPSSGTSFTLAGISGDLNYFQNTPYGTTGSITVSMSGSGFAATGQSGSIITSTFLAASPVPTVTPHGNVMAGSSVLVSVNSSVAAIVGTGSGSIKQSGVPVAFYLDAASTAVNGDGTTSATATTNSASNASASFAIDTGAGAISYYQDNVTAPIDGTPTHALGISTTASSTPVDTIGGPASTFVVKAFYGPGITNAIVDVIPSTTYNVNVALADAFGNTATNTGAQIQITLSASSGLLSATNVYISGGFSSTSASFGPISWTSPSTTGTVTLTASGVVAGHSKTVTLTFAVVSPNPTITVKTPAPQSGVIYAGVPAVLFTGVANSSLGYFTNTTIASVGYKIGSGVWQSASIVPLNSIGWQAAVVLPSGTSSVTFNATDSNGNVVVSPTFTVLVDTAAPDVNFVTAANANLSAGSSVSATIVDSFGDLNASTVTAVGNGTTALTATVTGTNNPGSSVSYSVTISGLTTGTWNIVLSASDLSGNTNSSTLTVNVSVLPNQTFSSTGGSQATFSGFTGASITFTNNGLTTQTINVYFVWYNSANQVVMVTGGSFTVAPGGTITASSFGVSTPGTYTVQAFVGGGLSVQYPITVTIS